MNSKDQPIELIAKELCKASVRIFGETTERGEWIPNAFARLLAGKVFGIANPTPNLVIIDFLEKIFCANDLGDAQEFAQKALEFIGDVSARKDEESGASPANPMLSQSYSDLANGVQPSEIWLPIESAPKDGSVIEVRHKSEGKIYKVRWAESKNYGADFWWIDGYVGQYDIHGTEWRPLCSREPVLRQVMGCGLDPRSETGGSAEVAQSSEPSASITSRPAKSDQPVSVSLCKWEISKIFVPDGVWNIEEGMKMERAVKAVLNAAGVPYVD